MNLFICWLIKLSMIEFSHWQVVHNSSNANVKSSESLSNIISLSKVAATERLKLIRAQIRYIFSFIVNECQVRVWIKVTINFCQFKSIKINEHKKWREISLTTRDHNNDHQLWKIFISKTLFSCKWVKNCVTICYYTYC